MPLKSFLDVFTILKDKKCRTIDAAYGHVIFPISYCHPFVCRDFLNPIRPRSKARILQPYLPFVTRKKGEWPEGTFL